VIRHLTYTVRTIFLCMLHRDHAISVKRSNRPGCHRASVRSTPRRIAAPRSASTHPTSGGEGVVGTLSTVTCPLRSSYTTKSAKVPPISTPVRVAVVLCAPGIKLEETMCRSQNVFDTVIPMVRGWI
jgi:hypothetical protein